MIKTGRYGRVSYNENGIVSPLTEVLSLNAWKLSYKTDYDDVTCFGDRNKVYVPGMADLSGSLGGFWNSDVLRLFTAAQAPTPGYLQLMPNDTDDEALFTFEGLAYLDVDIDCSLKAPKVASQFRAADSWIVPGGSPA